MGKKKALLDSKESQKSTWRTHELYQTWHRKTPPPTLRRTSSFNILIPMHPACYGNDSRKVILIALARYTENNNKPQTLFTIEALKTQLFRPSMRSVGHRIIHRLAGTQEDVPKLSNTPGNPSSSHLLTPQATNVPRHQAFSLCPAVGPAVGDRPQA